MEKDMDLEFLKGFADAHHALNPISYELAGMNSYAWNKIYRIQNYLKLEQVKFGEAYFADQKAA